MAETRGEVVVITGASAGVGRATARKFAKHGARIGLIARGRDGLEGAKRDVEALGGEAVIIEADVADPDAIDRAASTVEEHFGPIDIWINNAMTSVFAPVKETTAEEYKRVTEVNFLGFVNGTLAALHRMLPRDRGTIVQVGSALAHRSIPLQSAYCATKHAIIGFTDSLRCELLHDQSHIKVSVVDMPALNTPQFDWVRSRLPKKAQPVPPIYQPEVAADAIYWAAHHHPREMAVGWSTFLVMLGQKLAPGLADLYLARNGYQSQQTDQPRDPDRPDNLYSPVPGDHGAHGDFDDKAQSGSSELRLSENRLWVALGGLALAGVVLGTVAGVRKKAA